MARKGTQNPAADAASVTPLVAPLAAQDPAHHPVTILPIAPETQAAASVPGDDFVHHSKAREVPKRTSKACSVWVHGPAMLHILAEANRAFTKAAKANKLSEGRVERVHAYFQKSQTAVHLVPADREDKTALLVQWEDRKGAYINLYALLRDHSLDLPTGYATLCRAEFAPDSKVGPALVIYLTDRIQTKWTKKGAAAQAAPKAGGTAKEAGAGGTAKEAGAGGAVKALDATPQTAEATKPKRTRKKRSAMTPEELADLEDREIEAEMKELDEFFKSRDQG
jgi:hypothetical protein